MTHIKRVEDHALQFIIEISKLVQPSVPATVAGSHVRLRVADEFLQDARIALETAQFSDEGVTERVECQPWVAHPVLGEPASPPP